jgi:hypothetical protein
VTLSIVTFRIVTFSIIIDEVRHSA